ncbi:MAG: tRNA dihydrouridine(20/20a) synthase DusA [Alphaproteobacteria bacterium]
MFNAHRFSVAPMMQWTDRHCRYFHRQLTTRALLYTEMVTSAAIIHGNRERLLGFDAAEHPVALQIGGSDPRELAEASAIGAGVGYDEINLNVGCPSDRVQAGRFGASLMAEPDLVAECVAAMRDAVSAEIPVTVKCRVGIDDQDSETDFTRFIETVAAAGCTLFVVHARKAWLKGLSPKDNRDVPPLDYARVYRLKAARPDLTIVINGGIATLAEAKAHLKHVDGVMLGRAAYQNPMLLAGVDAEIFDEAGAPPFLQPVAIIMRMLPYIEAQLAKGERLSAITRHMLGLVHGLPGARKFRRILTEGAIRPGAGVEVVEEALAALSLEDAHSI